MNFLLFILSCGHDIQISAQNSVDDTNSISLPTDTAEKDTEIQSLPDDTGEFADPYDTDISEDPNTGITGYTNYKFQQVACPACLGIPEEVNIYFSAEFHEPITVGHTEWLPELNTCIENIYSTVPSTNSISVGSYLSVSSNSHNFSVPMLSAGYYYTESIWDVDYQRDSLYTVNTEMGTYQFMSAHGFDYIEPYTLLWIDPSYAYEAAISNDPIGYTMFSWGPRSEDFFFTIAITVYSWDGARYLGRVDCAGEDTGNMAVPGIHFQSFPDGSLVAVYLTRRKIELVETDINNSHIEYHTEWEVVGTGHIE